MATLYEFKRCARFAPDDDLVKVHLLENCCCDDSLYVSGQEYQMFREASLHAVSLAKENGFADHLEGTFNEPGEDVQKRLNQFARKSDFRGVEKMICQAHLEERRLHRTRAVKAILIGQEMAKQQGLHGCDLAEQLRKVALNYCLDAKVFARRLGKADEAACYSKKGHHNHPPRKSELTRLQSKRSPLKKTCNAMNSSGRLAFKQ